MKTLSLSFLLLLCLFGTAQSITVTSPANGLVWQAGYNQTITWTTTGTVGNVNIDYSTDLGTSWNSIDFNLPNTGSYVWNVNAAAGYQVLVRVSEFMNPNLVFGISDEFMVGPVIIVAPNTDRTICPGDTVHLLSNAVWVPGDGPVGPPPPTLTYSWNPTWGLNDPTIANPIASPPSTTNYTVTISDGTFTTIDVVTVNVNPLVGGSIVNNGNGVYPDTLDLTAGSGCAPYTYLWSTGATVEDVIISAAGYYTVTITSSCGCSGTASLGVGLSPIVVNAGNNTTICAGQSVTLGGSPTATGGAGNYTYQWTPTASLSCTNCANPVATPTTTTAFSVIATDAAGSADTGYVIITVSGTIGVSIINNNDGILPDTIIADVGSSTCAPFTYLWSDASVLQTNNVSATGIYTVTVVNNCGCSATAATAVGSVPVPATTVTNIGCAGGTTGSINVQVTGGLPPYQYSINSGSTWQVSNVFTGLAAGTYNVWVLDDMSNTGTTTATITQSPVLVDSGVITPVFCYGASTGSICLQPGGGTPGYTYTWSTGATSSCITNLPVGTYSYTVTDAAGCTYSATAGIGNNYPLLVATVTATPVSCFGGSNGSLCANVTGGLPQYTYTWNMGQIIQCPGGLPTGTYNVTITDANNCTVTANGTVNQPATPLAVQLTTTNVLCNGQQTGSICPVVTGGNPGYTYTWSNLATDSCQLNLPAGVYTVTVQDANNCTVIAQDTVWQPSDTVSIQFNVTDVTCFGGTDGQVCANGSGGTPPYTYNWNGGQTTACLTGVPSGVYFLQVNDANNCTVAGATPVNQPNPLQVSSTIISDGVYPDTVSISVIGGTPPYTYQPVPASWITFPYITQPGTYAFAVIDANGCGIVDSATTNTNNPSITVVYPNGGETLVVGQSVPLTWNNTGNIPKVKIEVYSSIAFNWITVEDSVINTNTYAFTVPNVPNTTGKVRISDPYNAAVNDESDALFSIVASGTFSVNVSSSDVLCNGLSNGSISILAGNGTAPYQYSIDGGVTFVSTNTFGNLSPGAYNIVVKDATNTYVYQQRVINEPAPIVLALNVTPNNCNGTSGSACVIASGGTGTLTYAWSNAATGQCVNGLTQGMYIVTVIDNNGCTVADTANVQQSGSNITLQETHTNVTCNAAFTGSACVTPSGGTTPYTYFWSNFVTTACITNIPAGNYTATVTDATGCTATTTVSVTEPAPLQLTVALTGDGVYPDTLAYNVTGGTPPYTYTPIPAWWNFYPTILADGVYGFEVADSNFCPARDSVYTNCNGICVWPGDANYDGTVDNNDLLPIGLGYNTNGPARLQQNNTWYGHIAAEWNDSLADGTNYKHVDCNGDGTINSNDTLAITLNYALTHPRSGMDEPRGGVPMLRVQMVPDTLVDGQTVIAHLLLGDSLNTATNVYGLAFTFNYDVDVVDSTQVSIQFNNNSWLCNNAADHIDIDKKFYGTGMIKTALTRIDQTTRSGNGEIGNVNLKITTGNINGKNLAYYAMHCYITDLVVIDNNGNYLAVDPGLDSATIEYEPTGISQLSINNGLSVYPNPTTGLLNISSKNSPIQQYTITNLLGEVVLQSTTEATQQTTINTAALAQGVYVIRIQAGNEEFTGRFTKQ